MNRIISLFAFLALTLVLAMGAFAQEDAALKKSKEGANTKIYRQVPNEAIEKVLQGLELKYQKDERKEKAASVMFFDFTRGNISYRLYNYGNDLWIETVFDKKMSHEDVNRWNAEAKFTRLVLIEQKEKTSLSLEAQLDCAGGVNDAVIRQYLNRFDEEAKKFTKSAAK
jgi:Putative bacterial sensory transduction regulator